MEQQNFKLEASNAKDTNELLRDLANNLIIGVYIVQDGKFLFTNSVFQKLVFYSEKELLGMDSLSLVYPEDRDRARENAVKMLKGESSSPYELRYVNKSGESSWVIETVVSILYQGRRATMGNFMNITDRKQAETKHRQLLEDINDGYGVIQEGKYVFANRRLGDIFGCEPGQVTGKSFDQFMMPNDRQAAMEQYERVMSGKETAPERHEAMAMKMDGTPIIIETSRNAIQYEGKPAFSIIFRDITESKLVETKYRQLLEDMSDGYAVIQEGKYIFANRRFGEIFKYDLKQILGKSIAEFMMSEDRQAAMESYEKVMSGEEAPATLYEGETIIGDGTIITIEASSKPIQYESKPAIGIIIRDITEHKRAEKKLQELYQQEVKLRESLEAEKRRKIEFIRVLVHELKTPLTPVMASSQLLAEELRDEPFVRLAKNIHESALNLSKRIDELFDLVRSEVGMLQLELEEVNLLPLLYRVADDIVPMASSNRHSIILDLPPSLPPVRADESRLQQIMLNLLNNASKFTPSGGKITIRAREKDTALLVTVRDTGCGMTEEEQQRLFEPYYRVESDRQRFSGMGLGLSLSKTLVELHGGQIWVESRQGEGSTFSFSLPLEDH